MKANITQSGPQALTFTLDVTKLVTLVDDKALIEVTVNRFPIHMRIFADEFFDFFRGQGNIGDAFLDNALDAINREFMKAQVVHHIIKQAE